MLLEKLDSVFVGTLGADYCRFRYVLGVSGGADSMALLHLCARLLGRRQILVAHYHHGLRQTATRDLNFVREAAARLGVPFVWERRKGLGDSEAALRGSRLEFLDRQRRVLGCDYTLTGHHLRDQLETLLMRLIRGSGMRGLAAIPNVRQGWFRPLLGFSREELEGFLAAEKIAYVEDESNASGTYLRNRIRHSVVPGIEQIASEFGGSEAFYRRLHGTLQELREAQATHAMEMHTLYHALVTQTPYWSRVTVTEWDRLAFGQRASLMRWIVERLGVPTLSRERLQVALRGLQDGINAMSLQGGLSVTRSAGHLYFQSASQKTTPPPRFEKLGNALVSHELGLELELSPKRPWEARTFRPGDRLGNTKLKKQLNALRIPRPERALWPLLSEQGSSLVVWHPALPHPQVKLKRLGFPFAVGAAH